MSGRVLDTSGQPLPGARLLLRNPADDARLPPTDVLARASGDGTFRMEVSLPDRSAWRFAGGRPLFTTEFIASAAARETLVRSIDFERDRDLALGDIVLKPGGSVLGRVLDPEGAPVEGAWVAVEDPAHAAVPEAERRLLSRKTLTRGVPAASDATGAFVLEGLPVGPARVWAGKPGFRGGRSALLEIGAGVEVRGADIRIEPERNEDRVEGRVLAPDGSVVSNADFNGMVVAPGRMHTAQFEEGIRNRADGSFSIPVHFPATYNVLVLDTYGRWGAACATSLRPGDRSVEIRFPEARRATLRVRNAAGEPVPSWHAHLDHATADLGLSFFGVRPGVHPGGAAEFLVPGFPFQIDLKSEGFLPMTLGPFDPAALPEPIEAVLAPIPGLRGRVLSGGRPLAGARVLALRVVQPGSKYVKDGLPMRWYDEDPEAEAKTAEDGTFTIPVKNPAKSVLRAEYPGLASAESGPLSAGEAEGVEIRLGKGGTLEGRVLLPPGRSPDGTIVAAHRGDNSPRSMRVGADGRYRFEGLTPGPWMLQEHEFLVPAMRGSAYSPGQSEFPWACTVVEGQAVTCDLDRSSEIGATLRGRVTAGGSGGAPGWSASLLPEGAWFQQAAAGPVTVARDGTFELVAPRAGSWRVLLTASEGGLRIFDPVPIADGETAWNLEVSFGRIEGTVQPGALVSCVVEEAGGRWSVVQGTADAEGRFVLPRVPAGRARLAIVDPAHRPAESDPRRWPARSEIDVKAGETTTL